MRRQRDAVEKCILLVLRPVGACLQGGYWVPDTVQRGWWPRACLPCWEGLEAAHPRQHSLTAGCREEAAFTLGPEAGEEARLVTRGRMAIPS